MAVPAKLAVGTKNYRWLAISQDIALLRAVRDVRPWSAVHGHKEKAWDDVAAKLECCRGAEPSSRNARARFDALIVWSKLKLLLDLVYVTDTVCVFS
jgi:hypothetical protein